MTNYNSNPDFEYDVWQANRTNVPLETIKSNILKAKGSAPLDQSTELERRINRIVRNIQDDAAHTQKHRDNDDWGYEKAKAEDNANDIYHTDMLLGIIQSQEQKAVQEEHQRIFLEMELAGAKFSWSKYLEIRKAELNQSKERE